MLAGFFRAAADLFRVAQPRDFQLLIAFVMDYNSGTVQSKAAGLFIAFRIFAFIILQALCTSQCDFIIIRTGLRIQSALTMAIYDKTTKLSNTARSSNPGGTIVNYLAADVERVKDLTVYGHRLWSIPLQMILALYYLYYLLGIGAFVGFAALIGVMPLNTFISKYVENPYPRFKSHFNAIDHS
jgi:ATP-binding cassette subfamily C (CFTR/MRP) protein 1